MTTSAYVGWTTSDFPPSTVDAGTNEMPAVSSLVDRASGQLGGRHRSRHPPVGWQDRTPVRRASKPAAMGYIRLLPGEGGVSVTAGIKGLEAFALSREWTLGEVFVDDDPVRPLLAWANLTVASRGLNVAAVLVPDAPGLRPSSLVLKRLRGRCAREIGTPLLLTPPAGVDALTVTAWRRLR